MPPHPINCLVCNVNKPTGRLEEWSYRDGDRIVRGKVYGDARGRWDNGSIIYTSSIVNIDVETEHLRTLNSLYVLGKRSEEYLCVQCKQNEFGFDDLSVATKLCDTCQATNIKKLQDAGAFNLGDKS